MAYTPIMLRRTLYTVLALGALAVATPAAAYAGPPVGQHQSVTYTYYSTAAKTTAVGWYSYGYCGEPFDYGTHTSYFTIVVVNC